jgi:hypothetical protein
MITAIVIYLLLGLLVVWTQIPVLVELAQLRGYPPHVTMLAGLLMIVVWLPALLIEMSK